jgi:nucleotide-binding universal stress UspA family protein
MFHKILIAYDGSEPARHAFNLALDLAEKYNAPIRVLAVARPPEFGDEVETQALLENSRKHYHRLLKLLKQSTRVLSH